MLGFEVYEEVSEELARGNRIWNRSWLDSQKKAGLVRSRVVVNQVRGDANAKTFFAATPPLVACCVSYTSGPGSVAIHCIGQNDRGVCHERCEIANGESRCLGTAVVVTSGEVLGWSS